MNKLLLSIIMVSTLLISCSKDSDNDITKPKPPTPTPPPTTEEKKIPISIIAQRADDSDTSFKSGDKVGLYVVNYGGSTAGKLTASGNQVDNVYFSYSGNWTSEKKYIGKIKTQKLIYSAIIPTVQTSPMSLPFPLR